jgi:hypothetical protein
MRRMARAILKHSLVVQRTIAVNAYRTSAFGTEPSLMAVYRKCPLPVVKRTRALRRVDFRF